MRARGTLAVALVLAPLAVLPAGCTVSCEVDLSGDGPAAEVLARYLGRDGEQARFEVQEVRAGALPDPQVTVLYGDGTARFLEAGQSYLVPLYPGLDGEGLASFVPTSGGCEGGPGTRAADGAAIDTGLLRAVDERDVLLAVALPVVGLFVVLGALAAVARRVRRL